MRKGLEIFSKNELAALQSFANQAKKEDKKIHEQREYINKQNQYIPKKEEKKPPQPQIQPKPIKKQEPPKPVINRPAPVKKEEKPIKKVEQVKPPMKIENKMELPKTSPAPRVEYITSLLIFLSFIKFNFIIIFTGHCNIFKYIFFNE